MDFLKMTGPELEGVRAEQEERYRRFQAKHLTLNMARGKPGTDQLELSNEMLGILGPRSDFLSPDGGDCRNYGGPDGLPAMRALFADMMDVDAEHVLIGGNSSLNMMFDTVSCGMTHGFSGCEPWGSRKYRKFLCPSPGYDRHFAVTEYFGFELIPVPMTSEGPDMDAVESLAGGDPDVKGIWCVPKYENPMGITYSDETVRRFAALKPAAADFRIFWDNAYCVHDLSDTPDRLLSLWRECEKRNSLESVFFFASTSKITFPGSGVSAMAAGDGNLKEIRRYRSFQTIGPDKLNQLRHLSFLRDIDGVRSHMKKHRALIEPKFAAVAKILEAELGGTNTAEWTSPKGGYFVSVNVKKGCAKRVVELCRQAGVTLTGAGAAFPYGKDPEDSNIRIAPTFPPVGELEQAMELFCICVRLAAAEKLLGERAAGG